MPVFIICAVQFFGNPEAYELAQFLLCVFLCHIKALHPLRCYIAFVSIAVGYIFKGPIFAINAVIRYKIMATIAAGIVKAAEVDFYVLAFQY